MKNVANLNHHLWNNHGTWFVCYTVYPTPVTKERRRESLRTKSVEEARRRRDELFACRRAPSISPWKSTRFRGLISVNGGEP